MNRKEFLKKSVIGTAGLGIALNSIGKALSEAERLTFKANLHRSIQRVIPAWEARVQPTLTVQRTLPYGGNGVIDPFLLLDHFGPVHVKEGESIGVSAHPHRGFEPVSFLFEGHVEHKDSLGNIGLLDSGGVQWMTSGSGIVHSEDMGKRYGKGGGMMNGIQLWVNIPAKDKMSPPKYQNLSKEAIPEFGLQEGKVQVRLVAGKLFDETGPASTFTPIMAVMLTMEPGTELEIPVPMHYNSFVQVLSGSVIAGEKATKGSTLVLFNNDGNNAFIKANPKGGKTDLLFLAGEPINEPVFQYGPFVMNTREEIEQAYADYRAGKMGRIDF